MRNRRWIALAIVLVLALVLLLPACTGPEEEPATSQPTTSEPTKTEPGKTEPTKTEPGKTEPTQTAEPTATDGPRYGGTFRSMTQGSLSNLGYSPTIPGHMTSFIFGCLEGFVKHNGHTGEFTPWLFVSWEEDPNEEYIIFHLRENVKYHDGSDFNAEGAKYYFELHQELSPGWLGNVTSIEVIDEYTMKFNTTHYDIVMWTALNEQHASPTQLAKGEEECLWNPVGTGPFKFVEYKRDQYLKYERYDDYWGGKPYLEEYVLVFKPDKASQLAALLAGEGEHLRAIEYKDIEVLEREGFEFAAIPMVECGLCPDQDTPESPMADVRVREAMEYAINKAEIAEALGYGYMEPFNTIYPTPMPGYVAGMGRQYDLDKAKQLMADANYADGFETTMHVSMFANMDVIVAVQQDLADIGITAHISEVDMGTWTSLRRTGWDGILYQHGIFQAPYEYNLNRAWGQSYADYVSAVRPEGFNECLETLLRTLDPEARLPLAEELQQLVYDSVMIIPLVTWSQIDAFTPKLHDHGMYEIHGTQCWFPDKAWLEE